MQDLQFSGIYKINFPNGKSYIGKSNNIKRRIKEHNCTYDKLPVHLAIQKYGKIIPEQVEILEIIDSNNEELLNQREIYWIEKYQTTNKEKGYNITAGGDGGGPGVHNPASKLTQVQLNEIYDLLQNHTELYIYQIAEMYNISPEAISEINTGKRYFCNKFQYPLRQPPRPFANVKKGVEHHLAKFNQQDIDEIYDLIINSNLSLKKIAEMKNASYAVISSINRGLRYNQPGYTYPLRKGINGNCKLNKEQINEIYDLLQNTSISYSEIAKRYNVCVDTIKRINLGKTYIKQGFFAYPLR